MALSHVELSHEAAGGVLALALLSLPPPPHAARDKDIIMVKNMRTNNLHFISLIPLLSLISSNNKMNFLSTVLKYRYPF